MNEKIKNKKNKNLETDGLPKFSNFFNHIDIDVFWSLWSDSLLITIIGFIGSIGTMRNEQ